MFNLKLIAFNIKENLGELGLPTLSDLLQKHQGGQTISAEELRQAGLPMVARTIKQAIDEGRIGGILEGILLLPNPYQMIADYVFNDGLVARLAYVPFACGPFRIEFIGAFSFRIENVPVKRRFTGDNEGRQADESFSDHQCTLEGKMTETGIRLSFSPSIQNVHITIPPANNLFELDNTNIAMEWQIHEEQKQLDTIISYKEYAYKLADFNLRQIIAAVVRRIQEIQEELGDV